MTSTSRCCVGLRVVRLSVPQTHCWVEGYEWWAFPICGVVHTHRHSLEDAVGFLPSSPEVQAEGTVVLGRLQSLKMSLLPAVLAPSHPSPCPQDELAVFWATVGRQCPSCGTFPWAALSRLGLLGWTLLTRHEWGGGI